MSARAPSPEGVNGGQKPPSLAPERAAGLLLHPTSLPGRFGIGDLGPEAEAFLDFALAGGQSVWQILPLGPTAGHGSPYSCLSAFAGNPLLISPDRLFEDGLLTRSTLDMTPDFREERMERDRVAAWKEMILRLSWERVQAGGHHALLEELEAFAADPVRAAWLEDWTVFSALKARFRERAWMDWPPGLRRRELSSLSAARAALAEEIGYHRYVQFLFDRQWKAVRRSAAGRGIRLMGDVPIYVALDSCDVWANERLFDLNEFGRPATVAGVPPDAFSANGQLWGNPLYRWDRIAEEGYAWWIARIRANLDHADILRLDHFRAFASFWEVKAGAPSAIEGRWRPGPGEALFKSLRASLGDIPLVAEDLGHITEDVKSLLAGLGLPGMKVLQFGFAMEDSEHHPDRCGSHEVVYTGTHDNDTVRGWLEGLEDWERTRALDYLHGSTASIHWDMIRAAYASAAQLAIVPVQDVFGLGREARMNDPRLPDGNWVWRALKRDFRPELATRLREMVEKAGRLAAQRVH